MLTTLGSWKDHFFWVSESIVPFKMVWRHPDAILNELEPSDSELDSWFLKSIKACPSRLCPFPEPLLVLTGISKLWDKPDRDPVLMRDGQGMHFGEDAVVRGSEHRFEGSDYVSIPNVKGFVKVPASKQCTRRSTRRIGAGQPSSSETIDLGDDLEVEDTKVPTDGKKGELPLVVGKDVKAAGKRLEGESLQQRLLKVPPMLIRGREALKANMGPLKKETEGFAEKELAWQNKVHELTQRHEVEIGKLKQQAEASVKEKEELEASLAQLAKDNKWLIEQRFQQVVTYLLHSSEFYSALGDVYSKLLTHGRHQGYIAGYDAGAAGSPKDKSPLFQPVAFEMFKNTVVKIERLTYPYVGEVSECYGKSLSVLQGLKPRGLNEAVCDEVLKSISKKRPHPGDSEDTYSKGGDGSKDSSLEASEVAAGGRKKRKAKKARDDGGKKDDVVKKDDAAKPTVSDAAK
ncbi:hypothetical protein HanPI659440_Chr15g0585531 [Helianthus annuus]|nr:hypothetical protein HanPI659440_Chr15g0585531 [Helianthus annuus]